MHYVFWLGVRMRGGRRRAMRGIQSRWTVAAFGVRQVYGSSVDSVPGLTDAVRTRVAARSR